jgi:hypothetical protein
MANLDSLPNLKLIVMTPAVLLAALTEVADMQRSPEDVMLYLLDNSETKEFQVRTAEDPG